MAIGSLTELRIVGGHPALDLANTVAPRPPATVEFDYLPDPAALLQWGGLAGVIDVAEAQRIERSWRAAPGAAEAALADVHELRDLIAPLLAGQQLERLTRRWAAAIGRSTLVATGSDAAPSPGTTDPATAAAPVPAAGTRTTAVRPAATQKLETTAQKAAAPAQAGTAAAPSDDRTAPPTTATASSGETATPPQATTTATSGETATPPQATTTATSGETATPPQATTTTARGETATPPQATTTAPPTGETTAPPQAATTTTTRGETATPSQAAPATGDRTAALPGGTNATLFVGTEPALMIGDRLADAIVDLLRNADVSRLRLCPLADGGCGWLFLDRSRNGSRRWCSMDDCGTHAKSRRLTERRRAKR
jgi:predicted RNA-binding Zn ribbon-like protein